jgi:hypothetical protein
MIERFITALIIGFAMAHGFASHKLNAVAKIPVRAEPPS